MQFETINFTFSPLRVFTLARALHNVPELLRRFAFWWLIVINEIRQISRNWPKQGPKFRKLQEAIWLTVINEIFKVPPHFDLFCQVNCFYKLSSGYPKDPTQKWYIWASFQIPRKRFRKLQETIWLTVIKEIFKFPPRLGSFCQINYLFELFLGYPSYPIQKWYIWASFQTSRKRFRKLQEAIWLIVIKEICKFQFHLFFKWTVCLNFLEFIRIT